MPGHDEPRAARRRARFELLARVGLAGAALACLALAPVLTRAALRLLSTPVPRPGSGALPGLAGDLLLGAVVLGGLAFAAWRYGVALWDPDRRGGGRGGLARRAGALLGAVLVAAGSAAVFVSIVGWGGPPAPRGGLERIDRFLDATVQGAHGVAPAGIAALIALAGLLLVALGVGSATEAARPAGARRRVATVAREPARPPRSDAISRRRPPPTPRRRRRVRPRRLRG